MSRALIVLPDDSAQPILDAINGAAKSLRVKMFVFSDPELLKAVLAARSRGVKVRIMLNPARRSGEEDNEKSRKALAAGRTEAVGPDVIGDDAMAAIVLRLVENPAPFRGDQLAIGALQLERLQWSVRHAYDHVPHYFHFRGPGTLFNGPEVMVEMFVEEVPQLGARTVVLGADDREEDLGRQHRELAADDDRVAEVGDALDEADQERVREAGLQERQGHREERGAPARAQGLRRLLEGTLGGVRVLDVQSRSDAIERERIDLVQLRRLLAEQRALHREAGDARDPRVIAVVAAVTSANDDFPAGRMTGIALDSAASNLM